MPSGLESGTCPTKTGRFSAECSGVCSLFVVLLACLCRSVSPMSAPACATQCLRCALRSGGGGPGTALCRRPRGCRSARPSGSSGSRRGSASPSSRRRPCSAMPAGSSRARGRRFRRRSWRRCSARRPPVMVRQRRTFSQRPHTCVGTLYPPYKRRGSAVTATHRADYPQCVTPLDGNLDRIAVEIA